MLKKCKSSGDLVSQMKIDYVSSGRERFFEMILLENHITFIPH